MPWDPALKKRGKHVFSHQSVLSKQGEVWWPWGLAVTHTHGRKADVRAWGLSSGSGRSVLSGVLQVGWQCQAAPWQEICSVPHHKSHLTFPSTGSELCLEMLRQRGKCKRRSCDPASEPCHGHRQTLALAGSRNVSWQCPAFPAPAGPRWLLRHRQGWEMNGCSPGQAQNAAAKIATICPKALLLWDVSSLSLTRLCSERPCSPRPSPPPEMTPLFPISLGSPSLSTSLPAPPPIRQRR